MGAVNTSVSTYGTCLIVGKFLTTGQQYLQSTSSQIVSTVTQQRSNVKTPNYTKLVKKGVRLPSQPFSYSENRIAYPVGMIQTTRDSESCPSTIRTGPLGTITDGPQNVAFAGPSAAEISAMRAQLTTKLLLKMKDQKSNFVQSYAERQQTIDLIGNTAIRLASAFRKLKKCDYNGAAKDLGVAVKKRKRRTYEKTYPRDQSEAAASGWLGLRYGWQPLIQDVYGAAEYTAQKVVREIRTKVTALEAREFGSTVRVNGVEHTKQTTYTIKGSVVFATPNETSHSAAQLGLTNPALIAWELLPFSFVADWFLPVGDYLSSLDATMGLSFVDGWLTTADRRSLKTTCSRSTTSSGYYGPIVDAASWSASKSEFRLVREKLTSFPSAVTPSFKNPLSVSHALNAIALITTVFSKLK